MKREFIIDPLSGNLVPTLSSKEDVADLTTRVTDLEETYVRITRFAAIGAGTSGTLSVPADNTVLLDDFGGTTDAIISELSGGRPTFKSAYTASGEVVAATLDASGNYVLVGVPAAYPVGIIYRTRCPLKSFDDTMSDIIGGVEVILPSDKYLTGVAHDATLTGDGTATSPLGISAETDRKMAFYSLALG